MYKDNFQFFVPAEVILEKADADPTNPNRYKNMYLQGCASDNSSDVDEETLEPNGFVLDMFKSGGLINYEHLSKKTPKALIGEPVSAEIRDNKFFIKGKLWEKHPIARDLWDTVHIMKESGSTRKLGWSIEGVPLQKDPRNPKHITKALITHVALTFAPKNGSTFAEICKGMNVPKDQLDYDIPTDVDYLYKGVFGDTEYTLNKDFTISKAMSAGAETGQQLIGQNTSGAALKTESLDPDLKILTIPISSIHWAADNWDNFKEDTKKAIQKGLHGMIEKGGEGTKGGRIIGHTKSGKPIYASHNHPKQEDGWDVKDHMDAAMSHSEESERYKKVRGGYDAFQSHAKEALRHKNLANEKNMKEQNRKMSHHDAPGYRRDSKGNLIDPEGKTHDKFGKKYDVYNTPPSLPKEITTEFDVRDALGGAISGNYEKDLARVKKQSNKTFSRELYNEAYQNTEQP